MSTQETKEQKQEEFDFYPRDISQVELKLLAKSSSLLPIWKWIQESGIPEEEWKDEVAVCFDMDGTLTNLGPPLLKKTVDERLRGGSQSRVLFTNMNKHNIKWFVLSARAATSGSMAGVGSSLLSLGLEFPEWSTKNPQNCYIGIQNGSHMFKPIEKKNIGSYEGKEYNAILCNNAISLLQSGEEYAFQKDLSLEYALRQYYSRFPRLVIFVDDNAKNVMLVYNHFKEQIANSNLSSERPVHIYSVLYDPQRKESDHDEHKALLDQELEASKQSKEEILGGGKKKKNSKTLRKKIV